MLIRSCIVLSPFQVESMATVWQPLQIGTVDAAIGLDETGVVASVSSVLVRRNIELFYWSTFSTGITLIPVDSADEAVRALSACCEVTTGATPASASAFKSVTPGRLSVEEEKNSDD